MEATRTEPFARANLYGLLARIARSEVDSALLNLMRDPEVHSALREAGLSLDCLEEPDDLVLVNNLATAYTHLFLLTLSPHESVQRGEGQLWGESTAAVNRFLDELGLEPANERSLLPDHLAIELEIMQHLTAAEGEALVAEQPEEAARFQSLQRRFFNDHLGAWAVQFFGTARQAASHPFYHEFADLGARFLFSEGEALG